MERQEHRTAAHHHEAGHQSAVLFAMAREPQKPSRLKAQVDKYNHKRATMPKSLSEAAMEKIEAKEREAQQQAEAAPAASSTQPPAGIEPRYYPRADALRGSIKLSKPRCLDWGIDPTLEDGWKCPFWEAPYHRFDAVAQMPGAKPETPVRARRWLTDKDWNNPDMHPPLKITHTLPKSNASLTRSLSALG